MTTAAAITLAIAVLGAALGLINTWHQLSKDRVKLRVSPKIIRIFQGVEVSCPHLCIEVVNLSEFAVTITSVGFKLGHKEGYLLLMQPILHDGKKWPRRLDRRESVWALFDSDATQNSDLIRVKKALAVTDCGVTRYGSVKGVRKHIAGLRKRSDEA